MKNWKEKLLLGYRTFTSGKANVQQIPLQGLDC